MIRDMTLWTYVVAVIVSFGTGGIYLWWLLWILKYNSKITSSEHKRQISLPYVYDTMLFFGVGVCQGINLYGRFLFHYDISARDALIHTWLWEVKNWMMIIPLAFLGVRALLRIRRSLPRD